jgi:DNA (cytosine-5)-methyltransferase 1
MSIKFADLFSGIGGFHAVGHSFGWQVVYACDIDQHSRQVYNHNWSFEPAIDITLDANDLEVKVPPHDVLFAGFPCQPFSKSGKQNGMEEARGTLFWNIAKTIEVRKPKIVLLENVPNLAGPRHRSDWNLIIKTLRELGYRVCSEPLIVSPHTIPKLQGGRPQTRKRIYLAATYVPEKYRSQFSLDASQIEMGNLNFESSEWNLLKDVNFESDKKVLKTQNLGLSKTEKLWLETWDHLIGQLAKHSKTYKLPGFPIWADVWTGLIKENSRDPKWKKDFIKKNKDFYTENKKIIDRWLRNNDNLRDFPASRRKLEWQAGEIRSLYKCLIQLRPSGIRVKRINYAPALVAINQTTIVGPLKRRMSVKEVAQLQGLPPWFEFPNQSISQSYKQLGNSISIGCAYQVLLALAKRDEKILEITSQKLLNTIRNSKKSPDSLLKKKP